MNLITLAEPTSPAAEAYRTLRTNLHFAMLDAPLRTLLVASPDSGQSAAKVLANLAVTWAQVGKRVIAVDADLREPSLHAAFDAPNAAGLTDWLESSGGSDDPPLCATRLPNLSLLPSGTPPAIPADLISSDRMARAIQRLADMADLVLFSAPPFGRFSDAAVLASRVDGVLLVVEAGKTRRDHAQQAKDILARAHARLIGAVMLGTK
ncbi:MAG: CpsD/CapB family tyrosine-protein kinase [Thermoflexales bacterium]|nr:CpsD/CapB family tyrosine-protein kinase [Thermoflexales bacterium]MDW8351018.1 CpsD/CapB family tyrosine-protein kinase [Anaerolineae bacterium]